MGHRGTVENAYVAVVPLLSPRTFGRGLPSLGPVATKKEMKAGFVSKNTPEEEEHRSAKIWMALERQQFA